MIFPTEFGELMLEREYTCEKSGVKTPLLVQIDKPRRLESDGPYICCWRMEPELIKQVNPAYACGEDGLQALELVSQDIESHLKLSMKRDGHAIYWLDPALELDLLHNHDLSARIAVAGILSACRDYLRLDAMPSELRRDVEAAMDWARNLHSQDKSVKPKPAKPKKAEKTKGPSARQLDYLRFIHAYIELHRRAPSENEIVMHMQVTAPSAHDMLVKLEELGYLARTPGVAHSTRILIDPKLLTKKL